MASDPAGTIGDRIRLARSARGMTQKELGDALDVTNAAVSTWEKGQYIPERKLWNKLVRVLDVTLEFLLLGKGAGPSKPKETDGRKADFIALRLRKMILDGRFDKLIYPRIRELVRTGKLNDMLRELGYRRDPQKEV